MVNCPFESTTPKAMNPNAIQDNLPNFSLKMNKAISKVKNNSPLDNKPTMLPSVSFTPMKKAIGAAMSKIIMEANQTN